MPRDLPAVARCGQGCAIRCTSWSWPAASAIPLLRPTRLPVFFGKKALQSQVPACLSDRRTCSNAPLTIMKLTSIVFASVFAAAAAHPSSVLCNNDDTQTTLRIGGVMMGQTVAAAPAGGATVTVTPARITPGLYYVHIDNIPATDYFAIRAAGSAVRASSFLFADSFVSSAGAAFATAVFVPSIRPLSRGCGGVSVAPDCSRGCVYANEEAPQLLLPPTDLPAYRLPPARCPPRSLARDSHRATSPARTASSTTRRTAPGRRTCRSLPTRPPPPRRRRTSSTRPPLASAAPRISPSCTATPAACPW
jgi:hypothetical protein